MRSAKVLIQEIVETEGMSLRKLASRLAVKPSTISRILNGKTENGSFKTHMKLLKYKEKLSTNNLMTRRS